MSFMLSMTETYISRLTRIEVTTSKPFRLGQNGRWKGADPPTTQIELEPNLPHNSAKWIFCHFHEKRIQDARPFQEKTFDGCCQSNLLWSRHEHGQRANKPHGEQNTMNHWLAKVLYRHGAFVNDIASGLALFQIGVYNIFMRSFALWRRWTFGRCISDKADQSIMRWRVREIRKDGLCMTYRS